MSSLRDLDCTIRSNRLSWLTASGCRLTKTKKVVACSHPDQENLNAVFDINCEGDEEATTHIQEALALIGRYSQRKVEVWLSPYCQPTSLTAVLTDLGLRCESVYFTLVAEPKTVRAEPVRDLWIWEVSSESRPTTVDALIDTYPLAFEREVSVREVEGWKRAMKNQEIRFFIGFKAIPTQGGPRPGLTAVVGQLITAHGIGGVYGIGTVPMFRKRGYASAMIAHIANEAKEAGLSYVYATTRSSITSRIFERVGLREITPQTQIWGRRQG